MKKGEMLAREDKNGIVLYNGLGTRYVRVLTTRYASEMVDINANSARTSRQKKYYQFVYITKVKQA